MKLWIELVAKQAHNWSWYYPYIDNIRQSIFKKYYLKTKTAVVVSHIRNDRNISVSARRQIAEAVAKVENYEMSNNLVSFLFTEQENIPDNL